jgi:hypothetical protein
MTDLLAGTIVGCVIVGLVVLVPALRHLFVATRDIQHAKRIVSEFESNSAQPSPELPQNLGKPKVNHHFSHAFLRAHQSFRAAEQRRTLGAFRFGDHFERIRDALGGALNPIRGGAGVLILSGLTITLFNLQHSVQHLKTAFQDLAVHSPTSSTSVDVTAVVTSAMAGLASSAHLAFAFSVGFILTAALLLICVLGLQQSAAKTYQRFVAWAHGEYERLLPVQTPLGEVAVRFDETAKSLKAVTVSFNEMTEQFGSIRDFAGSIENARIAIEDAMAKLPGHIQASMGTLSERFVASITEGLRESNENSKHVLAIYGHQQHRIDQIQAEAVAIGQYAKQVAEVTKHLEGLPESVTAASEAALDQAASANGLDSTVAELAIRVEGSCQ